MKLNGLICTLTLLAVSMPRLLAGTVGPSTRPIKFDYPSPWVREYSGEIGNNRFIGLSLRIAKDGKTATGCYFYYKYCKDIRIDAAIDGRSILVREYDSNGNQTGQFAGQFSATDPRHHFSSSDDLQEEVIVGDWSKPDGSQRQSFYMQEEFMAYWPEGTSRYAVAGFDDEKTVNRFMTRFRQAVLDRDAGKVASMVSFPIDVAVDGKIRTITDAKHFVQQYDNIFVADFVDQFRLSPPCHLFSKSEGVMLGNGEVWVSAIANGKKIAPAVTQINSDYVTKMITEDKALRLLESAPSFIAFTKRANGHWSCKTNSSGDNETEISVGHDLPDHFEVDETFKILRNGTVYIMCRDCDDGWKVDYQPKN